MYEHEAAVCVPLVANGELRDDAGPVSSIVVTVTDAEQIIDDQIRCEIKGVLTVTTSEVAKYAWECSVDVEPTEKSVVGTLESIERVD